MVVAVCNGRARGSRRVGGRYARSDLASGIECRPRAESANKKRCGQKVKRDGSSFRTSRGHPLPAWRCSPTTSAPHARQLFLPAKGMSGCRSVVQGTCAVQQSVSSMGIRAGRYRRVCKWSEEKIDTRAKRKLVGFPVGGQQKND